MEEALPWSRFCAGRRRLPKSCLCAAGGRWLSRVLVVELLQEKCDGGLPRSSCLKGEELESYSASTIGGYGCRSLTELLPLKKMNQGHMTGDTFRHQESVLVVCNKCTKRLVQTVGPRLLIGV